MPAPIVPDIIAAKPPMPDTPTPPDILPPPPDPEPEPELEPEPLAFPASFFFILIFPQSCHELQTLQTFPSGPSMRPGGRLGWVSLVVRSGGGCLEPELEPELASGMVMPSESSQKERERERVV
jgi:hypothetical protein